MLRVVVHPGFVRTATTTLQDAFPLLPGVHYLGIPTSDATVDMALMSIAKADGTRYRADAVRTGLRSHLDEGRLNVVSYENLACFKAKDKALVAQRLKAVVPEAKIVFTIRNQRDMVRSWYLLRRARQGYIPFDHWWAAACRTPHRSILDDVNFDEIVRCYEQLFGPAHVGVFLYEQLRDNPDAFAESLAAFTGLDASAMAEALRRRHLNASMTARHLACTRVAARFPGIAVAWWDRRKPMAVATWLEAWQARGPRARVSLSREQDALLTGLCSEGNRSLMTRRGLPLAQFGYPL